MAVSQALSVTEIAYSSNVTDNTSRVRILWTSTQTGSSRNEYTRTAKYYISINGGAETEYSVNYTLPPNTTKTILDFIITVPHRDDGTGSVSVRTWMDTSISAGVVERSKSISLHPIPRASTLTAAYATALGSNCRVVFTPLSASLWYTIKFALGSWSYTIPAFKPGVTSPYTYTKYAIPRDVANQFPNDPRGTMTATLYTHETETSTTYIGSPSSQPFTVTLPEDAYSKPSITMALSAVSSLGSTFSGLYVQGKSRTKASFTGSGKYNATIASYGLTVLGKGYASPFQTELLTTPGTVAIEGRAKDSRGFVTGVTQNITVIPYSKPKLIRSSTEKEIICARCDSSGNISESGTYLKIKVGRSYSKVMSGSTQKNFCLLRYRYKTESASNFSDYFALLAKNNTSTDYVDVTLGNVVTSTTMSYVVELSAIDDIGEGATVTFVVPTEDVTFNLRDGGDGAAFGKYAERYKALEIAPDWDLYYKGDKVERKFYSLRGNTKIPSGSNINNYLTPDIYAVETDTDADSIANLPINRAGLLRVYASTGQDKVSEGTWRYLIQEYRCVIGTVPTYLRTIYSDASGVWHYDEWRIEKGSDSGWISLKQSVNASTPTTETRSGSGCFYRVINENHVFVRFNCAFTFSGSSININSETIPSKYRPKNNAMALLPVNDRCIARASVASDGYIYVNYVQNMATASTTTSFSVTWIDGYIDYWL